MKKLLSLLLLSFIVANAAGQSIQQLYQKKGISFRGLVAIDEQNLWVSGTQGTVGRSTDAGKTWTWVSPKGYENYDFRDIAVLNPHTAVIVSAGTPAVILRSENAGETWQEVYLDEREEIFLDAMDFQGETGYIIGDPIQGHFQILRSADLGKNWEDISTKLALKASKGEAAFAASGSNILALDKGKVYIATGGTVSNFYSLDIPSLSYEKTPLAILSGESSTGVFSMDFLNVDTGVVIGGDYLKDSLASNNILLTHDGGKTWWKPEIPVKGYRSSVKFIGASGYIIASGTSGTDLSADQGKTWKTLSKEGFHVITAVHNQHKGNYTVYLAGSDGRIAKLLID